MKWIDDQEDYFLRDFNDKDGDKTATPAEGTDTRSEEHTSELQSQR